MEKTVLTQSQLESLIAKLSNEKMKLEDLSPQDRNLIEEAGIFDKLKGDLAQRVKLSGLDATAEAEEFLASLSDRGATQTTYRNALAVFLDWCQFSGVEALKADKKTVLAFVDHLETLGKAPRTRSKIVSGVSSWYNWLARRHGLKNHFRGLRAMSQGQSIKQIIIPSLGDIETALQEVGRTNPALAAAMAIMAFRGLRVGALARLAILQDGRFWTISKGQEITGQIPKKALKYLQAAEENGSAVFAGHSGAYWSHKVLIEVRKLFEGGKISCSFSAHDLRHFYAVGEYKTNRDIKQLKTLLGHKSLAVTQAYLVTLKNYE